MGLGLEFIILANGGFAHITTAYGNEVFYNISSDGAVSKNDDYIKPNMPFSITIESDIIDTTISDDVLISNIKECGEIIVKGTNGLVEFNKTAGDPTLEVSPTSIDVPQDGSEVSVQVTTNTTFTVS